MAMKRKLEYKWLNMSSYCSNYIRINMCQICLCSVYGVYYFRLSKDSMGIVKKFLVFHAFAAQPYISPWLGTDITSLLNCKILGLKMNFMTNPFVHVSLLGYAFISLCNGSELLQFFFGSLPKLDLGFKGRANRRTMV